MKLSIVMIRWDKEVLREQLLSLANNKGFIRLK